MKRIFIVTIVVLTTSCTQRTPTAQEIVDFAIAASGTEKLLNSKVSFTFRNIQYTYSMLDGNYEYVRIQKDTLKNKIEDILTNKGFSRYINGKKIDLTDEKRTAYTASINAVIYFAFLPLRLNDVAVNKNYEESTKINGKTYHKLKVTFDVEGGGEDHEDVFYYWFDTSDYSMDYLAYSYNEKKGKGMRFRVAYNSRKINGVTIQDYKNLKPRNENSLHLSETDQAYIHADLEELSLIELEDVAISTQ